MGNSQVGHGVDQEGMRNKVVHILVMRVMLNTDWAIFWFVFNKLIMVLLKFGVGYILFVCFACVELTSHQQ